MPSKRLAQPLASRRIPQNDSSIEAPRGERLAIWTESNAVHRLPVISKRLTNQPPVGHIPQFDRVVPVTGGERCSVRAEGQAQRMGIVVDAVTKAPTGCHIP
jgi:hypothetical protein